MSDSPKSIPKPSEKLHDAKKRTDTELKTLTKTAKGKQGKELISAKEKEIEVELSKLKTHWDLFNRFEAEGDDADKAFEEYIVFSGQKVAGAAGNDSNINNGENTANTNNNPIMGQQRELTKAQKKKLEKEDREADEDKKRQELIKSLPDLSKEENTKINKRLKKLNFPDGVYKQSTNGCKYIEVAGDGHCLFRAIRQQMELQSKGLKKGLYELFLSPDSLPTNLLNTLKQSYKITFNPNTDTISTQELRSLVAAWIKLHPDDYMPFLFEHEVFLNGGGIDEYCASLTSQDKVLWGGDCELNAISSLFNVPLLVVQAKGENPHYNKALSGKRMDGVGSFVVTFHEFWTSAGAHYNGVEPAVVTKVDGF